jgi:hypothetical protein
VRYTLDIEMTVAADGAALWQAWTDMERFPSWDPREEETSLDGPFQAGTTGWSKQRGTPRSPLTITAVTPRRHWQVETPLPGGKLVIDHRMDEDGDGLVRLVKSYAAYGPMAVAFRLYYGRKIRREMPDSFAALTAEANRLHAATTPGPHAATIPGPHTTTATGPHAAAATGPDTAAAA